MSFFLPGIFLFDNPLLRDDNTRGKTMHGKEGVVNPALSWRYSHVRYSDTTGHDTSHGNIHGTHTCWIWIVIGVFLLFIAFSALLIMVAAGFAPVTIGFSRC